MASEWRKTTIGKLIVEQGGNVKTGPFGTTLKASEYTTQGVPLISVREVGYGTLRIDKSTPRVSPATTERLPEYVLRTGDIVFGRKGAVDRSAHITAEQDGWFLGSDGIRLRLPENCDSRFVAYQVQSSETRNWLVQHATGTTMPSLNQGVIERVPIVLPPIEEQRAIAHILGALDDKIELNRRMNETLEEMARALFKSCFVDFDPVRAKAEGRDPGLPSYIADLFPDRFEDSALGNVPKGWTVEPLDQVAHFLNGLALQKYPPEGDEYLPAIKIAELRKGVTESSGRASTEIPSKYVVEDGDVLFSWSGSLEVELWTGGRGALNQHLFKVNSKRYPKWFFYYWVKQHLPKFRAVAADKATTMGHIKRQHLADALTVVPPNSTLQGMNGMMELIVSKVLNNRLESRTLAAVRNELLPKLVSGEIRVAAS